MSWRDCLRIAGLANCRACEGLPSRNEFARRLAWRRQSIQWLPGPSRLLRVRFASAGHLALLPYLEAGPLARRYDLSKPWNEQNPEVASAPVALFLCPSSAAPATFSEPLLGAAGMNFPCGDTFAANQYAYSKGTTDAWCLSGEVADERRGFVELNRRLKAADVTDGTSSTLAMGEADTGQEICIGHGCAEPHLADGTARLSVQSWISGEPGYDSLYPAGFVIGSAYATAMEPINKRPVTNTAIAAAGLNDCRASDQGGPHAVSNFRSSHPGGCQFLFIDGHVTLLDASIDQAILSSQATVAGGEVTP